MLPSRIAIALAVYYDRYVTDGTGCLLFVVCSEKLHVTNFKFKLKLSAVGYVTSVIHTVPRTSQPQ